MTASWTAAEPQAPPEPGDLGQLFELHATGPWQGLPAGTVAEYTAVTTGEVAGPADRVPGP